MLQVVCKQNAELEQKLEEALARTRNREELILQERAKSQVYEQQRDHMCERWQEVGRQRDAALKREGTLRSMWEAQCKLLEEINSKIS